ncbi:hypothetical protein [Helicobacter burdigaliensis]|uniref:hypothetical protein n=1 Tax=Helicobacter burdigaliensis TaxID=2315334 RepID=UPI00130088EB|nr:hypothetical protein [Helicobacter burdigaliensis]
MKKERKFLFGLLRLISKPRNDRLVRHKLCNDMWGINFVRMGGVMKLYKKYFRSGFLKSLLGLIYTKIHLFKGVKFIEYRISLNL